MHTNYYKIVKQLKSFKIIIVAPTCFGLHKPSSGRSQPKLRYSYNVDFGYISLFEVIGIVAAYFLHSCYACGSRTNFKQRYVTEVNIVTLAKHRLRAP